VVDRRGDIWKEMTTNSAWGLARAKVARISAIFDRL
jgi:hypothetical protein